MPYSITNDEVTGGAVPSVTSHGVSIPNGHDGVLRVRNKDDEHSLQVSMTAANANNVINVRPGETLELYVKGAASSSSTTTFYFFTDKPTGTVAFEVSS